jgi:FRG domain
MKYDDEFGSLTECIAELGLRYPRETLPVSRDIDTGEEFRGARFPRWLFRGEARCYETCRPTVWRLQQVRNRRGREISRITEFVYKYTAHHLVLPYIQDLEHFTSLEWMAISAAYEALGFCQHYGLPTALMDFTSNLRTAAMFASHTRGRERWGRVGVLDVTQARGHSQIIDLRAFSATRAARQKAYAVYIPGHADLCDVRWQRKVGMRWYRFRRDGDDEAKWQAGSPGLLRTENDRLAGWVRHAVSIYTRRVVRLTEEAARYVCGRIPLVPLVARRSKSGGGIAFQAPTAVAFDEEVEKARTMREWQRRRRIGDPAGRFTVYRRVAGTDLVRFAGT